MWCQISAEKAAAGGRRKLWCNPCILLNNHKFQHNKYSELHSMGFVMFGSLNLFFKLKLFIKISSWFLCNQTWASHWTVFVSQVIGAFCWCTRKSIMLQNWCPRGLVCLFLKDSRTHLLSLQVTSFSKHQPFSLYGTQEPRCILSWCCIISPWRYKIKVHL